MTPTPKHRGLGRGLDALLPTAAQTIGLAAPPRTSPAPSDDGPTLAALPLSSIHPNPEQPRRTFDDEALDLLSESIRTHGLLQPIVVEVSRDGYLLIAGERRWRAAKRASLATIPALIRPSLESRRVALELALSENIARENLSPLEEAHAFGQLADLFGMSHDTIAARVGRSRSAVSNAIRLLKLSPAAQHALAQGDITAGHARALLSLDDARSQDALLDDVIASGLSVRQTEAAAEQRRTAPPSAPAAPGDSPPRNSGPGNLDDQLVRRLEEALTMGVTLSRRRNGGTLAIRFYSDSELSDLYDRLGGQPL